MVFTAIGLILIVSSIIVYCTVSTGPRLTVFSPQEHAFGGSPPTGGRRLLGCRANQVVKGPFDRANVPGVHVNKIGVIEKSSQPGKWRLIVDLSHPEGRSINDFISSQLCS